MIRKCVEFPSLFLNLRRMKRKSLRKVWFLVSVVCLLVRDL